MDLVFKAGNEARCKLAITFDRTVAGGLNESLGKAAHIQLPRCIQASLVGNSNHCGMRVIGTHAHITRMHLVSDARQLDSTYRCHRSPPCEMAHKRHHTPIQIGSIGFRHNTSGWQQLSSKFEKQFNRKAAGACHLLACICR